MSYWETLQLPSMGFAFNGVGRIHRLDTLELFIFRLVCSNLPVHSTNHTLLQLFCTVLAIISKLLY